MENNELIAMLRDLQCSACPHEKECDDMTAMGACKLFEDAAVRIAELEAELKEERYRHDRVQDFEVAEAQELAKLREERRWIPVGERLPDLIPCNAGTGYSEAVIVWTSERKAMVAVWNGSDFLCAADYWEAWDEKITHWMPLPEPPKGG